MKRSLLTGLVIVLSSLAIASVANAKPVNFNSMEADYNGDGVVTLHELELYHLDHQSK